MKLILISAMLLLLCPLGSFAQTPAKQQLLDLSARIFHWEVSGQIDSIENVFHQEFLVVGSGGEAQTKSQYIARLRNGTFVHNAIDINESEAVIAGNTASVIGKGVFTVTSGGKQVILHLSYIEVFTRSGDHDPWKVLAMHASAIPVPN